MHIDHGPALDRLLEQRANLLTESEYLAERDALLLPAPPADCELTASAVEAGGLGGRDHAIASAAPQESLAP